MCAIKDLVSLNDALRKKHFDARKILKSSHSKNVFQFYFLILPMIQASLLLLSCSQFLCLKIVSVRVFFLSHIIFSTEFKANL